MAQTLLRPARIANKKVARTRWEIKTWRNAEARRPQRNAELFQSRPKHPVRSASANFCGLRVSAFIPRRPPALVAQVLQKIFDKRLHPRSAVFFPAPLQFSL